jgi:alanine racemase
MASTPRVRFTRLEGGCSNPPPRASESLRPARVEIDLAALAANFERLSRLAAPAGVLAVVKADAYGHGAPEVTRALEAAGAAWAGVALVEEAIELRREGVGLPILVLGTAHEGQLPLYRRHRLTPTVSSLDQLELWRAWARGEGGDGAPLEVHLKVDTGMHRLGVPAAAAGEALARLRAEPRLRLAGLLSHLAEADRPESAANAAQERRFAAALELLTAEERARVVVHLANSAACLHLPATRHRLVRLGLALYGLDPAGPSGGPAAGLAPVLSVVARVVQLHRLEAGEAVGYGGRWRAARASEIAIVPVGYADGYPWRLSTGAGAPAAPAAEALVEGRRVPLAGAVSMDMLALDVTGTGAALGAEVVLLGRRGGEEITAWALARRAGSIPHELLCGLGLRLPRRYVRGGREAPAQRAPAETRR